MTARRRHCELSNLKPTEEAEKSRKARLSQSRLKTNRLTRGLKQTQKSPTLDSSYNKDMKTPKRYTRVKHLSYDSPSNESELQQDIFWDPTSPTPVRNGKGGNKSAANGRVVEISDIVNRIAPKEERHAAPEVVQLEKWIGDSAVPCTPEVQHTRVKKKSASRQNGVEDLMKLAKQFDINMIQQDKEQSSELQNTNMKQALVDESEQNDRPLSVSEDARTSSVSSFKVTDPGVLEEVSINPSNNRPVDLEADDDMDALFDGPTQYLSGRLSQGSSNNSQEAGNSREGAEMTKPAAKSVCEKGDDLKFSKPPENNPYQALPAKNKNISSLELHANNPVAPAKPVASNNDFDDDWGSDDLLDDSFVLEIMQNPNIIAAPKQAQHLSNEMGFVQAKTAGVASGSSSASLTVTACGKSLQTRSNLVTNAFQGKNEKAKNRSTFTLDANPQFVSGDASKQCSNFGGTKPAQQKVMHHHSAPLVGTSLGDKNKPPGSATHIHASQKIHSGKVEPRPYKPFVPQSSVSSGTTKPSTAQQPVESTAESSVDMDSFFDSDPLWDDGSDDDLLYQACDDVEKISQSQGVGLRTNVASTLTKTHLPNPVLESVPAIGMSRALSSAQSFHAVTHSSNQCKRLENIKNKPPTAFNRSYSLPANSPIVNTATSSCGKPAAYVAGSLTQKTNISNVSKKDHESLMIGLQTTKNTIQKGTGYIQDFSNRTVPSQTSARILEASHKFSFKRHLSDPVALTNKVFLSNEKTVKCSKEEIERKKQEAMARRRLWMQASQKNGAST
ncbi:ewing's tumor-associated antigen 1 homolog [Amia ocellicauda]|uniref:ewing's tumor-associated antigen 1 homolog n=1 Tax=Amia ocellicauda TaxID=2972642 RepID=UPI0034643EC1